jgi:hypothetical protein
MIARIRLNPTDLLLIAARITWSACCYAAAGCAVWAFVTVIWG